MRRPEGHRPSYPAFTARFPDATDTIVFAQLAIRGPDLEAVTAAARELDALLDGETANSGASCRMVRFVR
ncbi:hypothetical protein [Streptomyces yerevanensis]|uniref:hypothetical protein n=1 Tax=Streptomyces yerevanensis TaxID=66378 RepID=UPI000525F597|nr:hypothetical protein [Streptomyces yerevanensis]